MKNKFFARNNPEINSVKFCVLLWLILILLRGFSLAAEGEALIRDWLWNRFLQLPDRPKIGLALGGGGARGFAHLGVLKVFVQQAVPVDIIAGTSVGGIVGAFYAAGISFAEIEEIGRQLRWSEIARFSPTLKSFFTAYGMDRVLRKGLGKKRFVDLKIPFGCVACDLRTGEKIFFREGELIPAIRASSAAIGWFEPVEYQQRTLVDGGIIDSVPVDLAELMGADFIIGVPIEVDWTKLKLNSMLDFLYQGLIIQRNLISKDILKGADFIIRPDVEGIGVLDMEKIGVGIQRGEFAAHRAVDEIKDLLLERHFVRILSQWEE